MQCKYFVVEIVKYIVILKITLILHTRRPRRQSGTRALDRGSR